MVRTNLTFVLRSASIRSTSGDSLYETFFVARHFDHYQEAGQKGLLVVFVHESIKRRDLAVDRFQLHARLLRYVHRVSLVAVRNAAVERPNVSRCPGGSSVSGRTESDGFASSATATATSTAATVQHVERVRRFERADIFRADARVGLSLSVLQRNGCIGSDVVRQRFQPDQLDVVCTGRHHATRSRRVSQVQGLVRSMQFV